MYIILDTSVWVSYFNNEEPHHADSQHFINGLGKGCVVLIPLAVQMELVQALRRQKITDDKVYSLLARIRSFPNAIVIVAVDEAVGKAAMETQSKKLLRFGDSLLVGEALVRQALLVTLDDELLDIARWARAAGFEIRKPS